jgi:NADH-quinone oxidoreductase subunit H
MVLIFIVSVVLILIMIAFFTLAERKVIGGVQRRLGPSVVGIFGSLQAIADIVKLVFKEIVIPSKITRSLFLIAPAILLALSFVH